MKHKASDSELAQRHSHMPAGINNSKGETIIEVLCAILIAGLASGLLMSCFTISRSMAHQAQRADERLLKSISIAERQNTEAIPGLEAVITYGSHSIEGTVNAYGGNNVYSYKKFTIPSTPAGD